jgi:hypothetical protein
VVSVHEGYKPAAADLDFDKRKGKMAGLRWTESNLLAAAVVQGMGTAAALAVVAVALVVWAVWGLREMQKENDRLQEMSAGVE